MKESVEKKRILEVCVDSVESALAARRGGADRLELCSNLLIGGTSPSPALFDEVREAADIRIHVLLRPRFGDFLYSDAEFAVLRREVRLFRERGADGVVIGLLTPDGELDVPRMKILMEEAGDQLSVTLHRAFDVCRDPYAALEEAKELGIQTILTSGQKNTCLEGRTLLKELNERAGAVTIMAGSGVSAEAIRELGPDTGIRTFHLSGKKTTESAMRFRREGVPMGLPLADEYTLWQTDEEKIRKARAALDAL